MRFAGTLLIMNESRNFPDHVHVIDHPLIANLMTTVRDHTTEPAMFRESVRQIGYMLGYEATRDLVTKTIDVQTPLEMTKGSRLATPVTIVPILRAGLGMADGVLRLIPQAHMGHLGMFRDEDKLAPVSYYENLPTQVTQGPVLLIDPMLATAGSAVFAIDRLKALDCKDIRFICLIAAPEGIEKITEAHPDVAVYTATVDRQLNDIGYILPGLGDAGDRIFGTLET